MSGSGIGYIFSIEHGVLLVILFSYFCSSMEIYPFSSDICAKSFKLTILFNFYKTLNYTNTKLGSVYI